MNVLGGALVSIGSQGLLRLQQDHMTLETFMVWVVVCKMLELREGHPRP